MKNMSLIGLIALLVISSASDLKAQPQPPKPSTACAGEWRLRTGPAGTKWLCFDRKYSTCYRDSIRMGWGAERGKAYCDNLYAQGRLAK